MAYTIMEWTAAVTVCMTAVQQTHIDILHSEDKPQNGLAKKAG